MPNLDSGPSNVHKLPISTLSPSSRESHKMEVGVYTWLLMVLLHTLHSYTLLNTNILVFYCTLKYTGEVMPIVFSFRLMGVWLGYDLVILCSLLLLIGLLIGFFLEFWLLILLNRGTWLCILVWLWLGCRLEFRVCSWLGSLFFCVLFMLLIACLLCNLIFSICATLSLLLVAYTCLIFDLSRPWVPFLALILHFYSM